MKETFRPAIVSLFVFTVLCGLVYPLVMDGLAAVAFPHQATGSLIHDKAGKIVGSELVGQPFDHPAYFWSRLTAEANYDASNSTGTNLGPSNPTLTENAKGRIAALRAVDPGNTAPIPVDLVTASGSGLDPHISPAAAYYQVARVARQRGKAEAEIRALVDAHIEGRTFGVLGEPRVNVVMLNRALDAMLGGPPPT